MHWWLCRYARSGREVLGLWASMCIATLRLRDLVHVLLLLGSNDPAQVRSTKERIPQISRRLDWGTCICGIRHVTSVP
jgi:hypothetical protein